MIKTQVYIPDEDNADLLDTAELRHKTNEGFRV